MSVDCAAVVSGSINDHTFFSTNSFLRCNFFPFPSVFFFLSVLLCFALSEDAEMEGDDLEGDAQSASSPTSSISYSSCFVSVLAPRMIDALGNVVDVSQVEFWMVLLKLGGEDPVALDVLLHLLDRKPLFFQLNDIEARYSSSPISPTTSIEKLRNVIVIPPHSFAVSVISPKELVDKFIDNLDEAAAVVRCICTVADLRRLVQLLNDDEEEMIIPASKESLLNMLLQGLKSAKFVDVWTSEIGDLIKISEDVRQEYEKMCNGLFLLSGSPFNLASGSFGELPRLSVGCATKLCAPLRIGCLPKPVPLFPSKGVLDCVLEALRCEFQLELCSKKASLKTHFKSKEAVAAFAVRVKNGLDTARHFVASAIIFELKQLFAKQAPICSVGHLLQSGLECFELSQWLPTTRWLRVVELCVPLLESQKEVETLGIFLKFLLQTPVFGIPLDLQWNSESFETDAMKKLTEERVILPRIQLPHVEVSFDTFLRWHAENVFNALSFAFTLVYKFEKRTYFLAKFLALKAKNSPDQCLRDTRSALQISILSEAEAAAGGTTDSTWDRCVNMGVNRWMSHLLFPTGCLLLKRQTLKNAVYRLLLQLFFVRRVDRIALEVVLAKLHVPPRNWAPCPPLLFRQLLSPHDTLVRGVKVVRTDVGPRTMWCSPSDAIAEALGVEAFVLHWYAQTRLHWIGCHAEGSWISELTHRVLSPLFLNCVTFPIEIAGGSPFDFRPSRWWVQRYEQDIRSRLGSLRKLCECSDLKYARRQFVDLLVGPSVEEESSGESSTATLIESIARSIPMLPLVSLFEVLLLSTPSDGFVLRFGGFPDLVMWTPDYSKFKLVEVKSPSDKLSDAQLVVNDLLLRCGFDVEVATVIDSSNPGPGMITEIDDVALPRFTQKPSRRHLPKRRARK